MNGMITTNADYDLEEVKKKCKEYSVSGVVDKVTTREVVSYKPGDLDTDSNIPATKKVAILDVGTKFNIARCLLKRGCEVTIYPARTNPELILKENPDGIMLTNGPGIRKSVQRLSRTSKHCMLRIFRFCHLPWTPAHGTCQWSGHRKIEIRTPRCQSSG